MDSQNNKNLNTTNNINKVPAASVSSGNNRVSEPTILPPKEPHKRKRRWFLILLVLIVVMSVIATTAYIIVTNNNKDKTSDENKDDEVEEDIPVSTNTTIVFGNEVTVNGTGATAEGNNVTITSAGTYVISGDVADGSITVNAPAKEVTLMLGGTKIKSTSDAAIKVLASLRTTITLKDGTTNYVEDGGTSQYDAAIYSSSPITINGTGALELAGNVKNGIAAESTDITVNSGKIKITSPNDGIKTSGVITINGGNMYIDASTYSLDSAQNVTINGGEIYLVGGTAAVNSGTNSEGTYLVNGGTVVELGSNIVILPDEDSTQKTLLFNFASLIKDKDIFSLTDNKQKEIVSFVVGKEIKTITISTADIANATYNLYSGVKHAGMPSYGIYPKDEMTLGTQIKIDNTSDFVVEKTNNWFGVSTTE